MNAYRLTVSSSSLRLCCCCCCCYYKISTGITLILVILQRFSTVLGYFWRLKKLQTRPSSPKISSTKWIFRRITFPCSKRSAPCARQIESKLTGCSAETDTVPSDNLGSWAVRGFGSLADVAGCALKILPSCGCAQFSVLGLGRTTIDEVKVGFTKLLIVIIELSNFISSWSSGRTKTQATTLKFTSPPIHPAYSLVPKPLLICWYPSLL